MGRSRTRAIPIRWALIAAACAAGCGGAASAGPSATTAAAQDERPLDWALLLPIETEGVVRLDLARMRRSPHNAALEPVLEEMLGDFADPGMRQGLADLIARTDVVLIALMPEAPDREDEVMVLAHGDYAPDEIERLNAAAGDTESSRAIDVRGQRVWIGVDPEDTTAVAQLRPDTLAMTSDRDRMDRLIARTTMASNTPRWPPSLRPLIEASQLEGATFGLALANRRFGPDGLEAMEISLAGTADADGPLDVQVIVEMGDPVMANAGAMFIEGMIRELAQSASGEAFALGSLARLARIQAEGTRIRGSIHADEMEARQLVPGLMGLLRDGMRDEVGDPDVISPLPTPL